MDRRALLKEINEWQEKLVELAALKKFTFSDPEVYHCSCKVDRLIVEYINMTANIEK